MDKYLINAREELLRHIEALDKVRCADPIGRRSKVSHN